MTKWDVVFIRLQLTLNNRLHLKCAESTLNYRLHMAIPKWLWTTDLITIKHDRMYCRSLITSNHFHPKRMMRPTRQKPSIFPSRKEAKRRRLWYVWNNYEQWPIKHATRPRQPKRPWRYKTINVHITIGDCIFNVRNDVKLTKLQLIMT